MWSDEDYKAFTAKTTAVAGKLSQITFGGQPIIGSLTADEAIADLGGLSSSVSIARDNNLDIKAIFQSWANVWAARMPKEVVLYLMSYETHLPPKLRVNFTAAQLDEFYKEFNIQPGDGMYKVPEDRVSVW